MKLISYFLVLLAASFLTGCAGGPKIKEVYIPVPVGCPLKSVQDSGEMPEPAAKAIKQQTPVDVAARLWKASYLELLGFAGKQRIEKETYRQLYIECTKVGNPLNPAPEEQPDPSGR